MAMFPRHPEHCEGSPKSGTEGGSLAMLGMTGYARDDVGTWPFMQQGLLKYCAITRYCLEVLLKKLYFPTLQ